MNAGRKITKLVFFLVGSYKLVHLRKCTLIRVLSSCLARKCYRVTRTYMAWQSLQLLTPKSEHSPWWIPLCGNVSTNEEEDVEPLLSDGEVGRRGR